MTSPAAERSRRTAVTGRRTRSLRTLLGALLLAGVSGLTYARLYFGVDLTDESFYVAVPYRLATGARPLLDETNVAQLPAGILLYPFVKLYETTIGLEGIVLYARHLHFLFTAVVALLVFRSLSGLVRDGVAAALVAGTAVAFVPFGIHGLSYNTFAAGFFGASCFLGAGWLADPRRPRIVATGAAGGLAIFAYPPFAVPVLGLLLALYLLARPRSVRDLAPAVVPVAACGLAVLVLFLHHGVDTARELFSRASTYTGQGGGLDKAVRMVDEVLTAYPHPYAAVGLLVAAFGLQRWRAWAAVVPLVVLPLSAIPDDLSSSASANALITNVGLLAPGVFALNARDGRARILLLAVWLPALVAGEVTAVSSGNGSINFSIGFLPGAMATVALAILAIQGAWRAATPDAVRAICEYAPAGVVLAACLALQYTSVYRDASISHLTTRIGSGPYAGIHTTAGRRDFLGALDRDLRSASGPACRIVFYDSFPAGYLFGHGVGATNTALLFDVADDRRADYDRLLLDYYRAKGWLPDVAVRIDRLPLSESTPALQTYRGDDPLERLLASPRYETVVVRQDYRIRRLAQASC